MDISSIAKDVQASKEGVWFPIGPSAKLKIAQWMNEKHSAFLRSVSKKYGRRMTNGAMTEEEIDKVMSGQWEFILTDFSGLESEGVPIEWSAEYVAELSLDKRYEDFFSDIKRIAKDDLNFRIANIQSMGEQSPTTQSGEGDGRSKTKKS